MARSNNAAHVLTGAETAARPPPRICSGLCKVEASGEITAPHSPASLVVMAVAPSFVAAGLRRRGLRSDAASSRDPMVTSDPDILSVGECVEHDGGWSNRPVRALLGHVPGIWPTADRTPYRLSRIVTSPSSRSSGIDVFSAVLCAGGGARKRNGYRSAAMPRAGFTNGCRSGRQADRRCTLWGDTPTPATGFRT